MGLRERSCKVHWRAVLRCNEEDVLHLPLWSSPHGRVKGRTGSAAHVLVGVVVPSLDVELLEWRLWQR
jgi:hypothetical protein